MIGMQQFLISKIEYKFGLLNGNFGRVDTKKTFRLLNLIYVANNRFGKVDARSQKDFFNKTEHAVQSYAAGKTYKIASKQCKC